MKTKRRVIIAHGWRDSPANAWIVWLRTELEAQGFEVTVPKLPNPNLPRLDKWLATLNDAVGTLDKNTTLVGYSLGTATTLRLLDNYPQTTKIAGLVLVAGFGEGIRDKPRALFSPPLNFNRIQARARVRVMIYSDNDPIVPMKRSQQLAVLLGAREVMVMGGRHFLGSKRLPGSAATIPAVLGAVLSAYPQTMSERLRKSLSWARVRLRSKIKSIKERA